MFAQTILAAALAASSAFVAALPANAQQAAAVAGGAVEAPSSMTYTVVSPDGSCGGVTGYTCEGSAFGNCCSISGFCGATDAFCGADCFSKAGLCSPRPSTPKKKKGGDKPEVAAKKDELDMSKIESLSQKELDLLISKNKAVVPADAPSPVVTPPQVAVHTPWKPTPFRDANYKPSYIIDNGERAPNQVWN
ncbi:hypothetical protein AAFC00_002453 [Neodothiora populina]|uniref:Chitin-binding type-1 domain-containing protein n=1 Tax=Neodothiora populina TaxID=2781224 RepID=A0ABR3P7F7_9PEZI